MEKNSRWVRMRSFLRFSPGRLTLSPHLYYARDGEILQELFEKDVFDMTTRKDPGRIRRMFADISPRYDLLNHLLSLNIDRRWRRRAVRALSLGPRARILDICTGTGDLALALADAVRSSGGRVTGADFTPEMVRIGEAKRRRRRAENLSLVVADSLRLPFDDASFDAVTVAFGIRNVVSLETCLGEMLRVLRPGGEAAILEFSPPGRGVLRLAFETYFRHVLPRIGRIVSGSRAAGAAYAYLPESVGEFPPPPELSQLLERCGFRNVRCKTLTLGVAVLHVASRQASPSQVPPLREPAHA
jgi:demethylmenaquinone methyltransferase/2-methoxy-6-polyprenyl-1,4-benzoquinol methylase